MPELTEEHKQALALGRKQGHVVRRYLEALEMGVKPRNGTDPEAERKELREKLDKLNHDIETTDSPIQRVQMIQDRLEVEEALAKVEDIADQPDITSLEDEFKAVVADYASRKGLTYKAFREVGVPAKVLKEAGVS